MLKATQIFKNYGEVNVLKGVSFSIANAEIVSIIGASGAGKSTLLQIIGTLNKADSGTLEINNQLVSNLKGKALSKFRNQQIGFVFQFHHLLPEFTALENVCIPAWIKGDSKIAAEKKAKELLSRMQLSHRLDNKPSQLSGGEQQRVAIARALINSPSLILMDEPTGNLDTQNSVEVYKLIHELRDERKQTFVIVTHNQEFAKQSDRVVEMKDGVVV
ncbi:MAG: ABC transporter ATP-binding protein [Chitinophagaceae bacterium]|nr:ABC transporter ATP-binding protein [Chitinophagaceae bacterium]